MSLSEVRIVQGSVEYLYADLRTDRVLDTQAVAMSISPTADPGAWITAEWFGPVAKYRSARILLDGSLTKDTYYVFARITDIPEAPIIQVGYLKVV